MIQHVEGTSNNERTWQVKMDTGVRLDMPSHKAKKLISGDTTWAVERVSAKLRFKMKEFRLVYWKGFKRPTREPVNFLLN